MKSLHYAAIPGLLIALVTSGCSDSCGGFSGSISCGTGAGGAGGGGSGSGSEPHLAHMPEFSTALFGIEISGDASRLVLVSNQNVTGQNDEGAEQIFGVEIGSGNIVQITTAPETSFFIFLDFDITDDGSQVLALRMAGWLAL